MGWWDCGHSLPWHPTVRCQMSYGKSICASEHRSGMAVTHRIAGTFGGIRGCGPQSGPDGNGRDGMMRQGKGREDITGAWDEEG